MLHLLGILCLTDSTDGISVNSYLNVGFFLLFLFCFCSCGFCCFFVFIVFTFVCIVVSLLAVVFSLYFSSLTNFPHCKKMYRRKKRKKREIKKKSKRKKKKALGEKKTASLRERSETPGALDRRVHWESQETPVAQSHLSASVRITGYRRSGCRPGSSRLDSVRGGRTRNSIIGEATFRSQSASE